MTEGDVCPDDGKLGQHALPKAALWPRGSSISRKHHSWFPDGTLFGYLQRRFWVLSGECRLRYQDHGESHGFLLLHSK